MSFLTKYGSLYGWAPQLTGNIYYVAPAASYTIQGNTFVASNDNDGLSPERALRSPDRFVTLATADAGDVCLLLPGTHTLTATLAINKAGLTFLGAGPRWEDSGPMLEPYPSILSIVGTNDELLNITASRTEIGYVTLRPQNGYSAVSFQGTAAYGGLKFHHFNIDMTTRVTGDVSVDTRGLDFGNRSGGTGVARLSNSATIAGSTATAYVWMMGVVSDGAQGEAVHLATCHVHMRDCRIHNNSGTWASPFIIATNCDQTVLERIVLTTSGTMSSGINGNASEGNLAADAVTLIDCRFGFSTDDVEGFPVGSVNLLTSYQPASGGTLSTIS